MSAEGAREARDLALKLSLTTIEERQAFAEKSVAVFQRNEMPSVEACEELLAYCRRWGLKEPVVEGQELSYWMDTFRNWGWAVWAVYENGHQVAHYATRGLAEKVAQENSLYALFERALSREGFLWRKESPLPVLLNLPIEEQREAREALAMVESIRTTDPKLADEALAALVKLAKDKIIAQKWKDLGL